MKHIGSSMLTVMLLLQACGSDTSHPNAKTDTVTQDPDIATRSKAISHDVVEPSVQDPNAPLSHDATLQFYMAMSKTSIGQDGLKGVCGNVAENFKPEKQDRKNLDLKLPFRACQTDKTIFDGVLQIAARFDEDVDGQSITKGTLKVHGDMVGSCLVEVTYPVADLRAILPKLHKDNSDLNMFAHERIGGTLCGVSIEALRHEAAEANAQASLAASQLGADQAKAEYDAAQANLDKRNKEAAEAQNQAIKAKADAETKQDAKLKAEAIRAEALTAKAKLEAQDAEVLLQQKQEAYTKAQAELTQAQTAYDARLQAKAASAAAAQALQPATEAMQPVTQALQPLEAQGSEAVPPSDEAPAPASKKVKGKKNA